MTAYDKRGGTSEDVNICVFLDNNRTFELIEDNTIDIDSIEDMDTSRNYQNYELTLEIDKLIQAVKQLNKEIKELKEKE